MYNYIGPILLTLTIVQLSWSQERPGKPEDRLKPLQGRWVLVEGYSWDPQLGRQRISGGKSHKPELEIEFIGKVGVMRIIREDGSRSKPAPVGLSVDPSTDPISFDEVSYPIKPGGRLFFIGILKVKEDKLYLAYSPDRINRPKSFDIFNDAGVWQLAIYQRVKD